MKLLDENLEKVNLFLSFLDVLFEVKKKRNHKDKRKQQTSGNMLSRKDFNRSFSYYLSLSLVTGQKSYFLIINISYCLYRGKRKRR